MARLITSGFEGRSLAVEGLTSVGTVTFDTTNQFDGTVCAKCGKSAENRVAFAKAGATGTTYYFRAAVKVTSVTPTSNVELMRVAAVGNISPTLLTNGKISLWNSKTASNIVSEVLTLEANKHYLFELKVLVPAAGNGTVGFKIYNEAGETKYESGDKTVDIGTTAVSSFTAGHIGSETAADVYVSHFAVNDSTGSAQNSYSGFAKVVELKPVEDGARTGWSVPGGATTNLWKALDNRPPEGIADSTSAANAERQIRDPENNATDTFIAVLAAYETALGSGGGGIPGSSTIRLTQAIARGGTSSATGRELKVRSEATPGPDEAEGSASTSGTAGTETSGWVTVKGSVNYEPSVSLSTKPQVRVRKGTASTSVMLYDLIGLLVEFVPGVPKTVEGKAAGTGTGSGSAKGVRGREGKGAGQGTGSGSGAGTRGRLGAAAGTGTGSGSAKGVRGRVGSFAHSGNPTTTPTGVLPKTKAGDILVIVVSNGGSNADPAIGGTSVAVGGLTWTKELSSAGIEGNPFNASLWWARASGDHSGQTVVASTVGSGSLVGASYRGVLQSGDPFRFAGRHVDPIKEGNGVIWSWAWDSTSPPALKAGDLVLCGYCADDNPAAPAKPLVVSRFVGEGKKFVWEEELREDSVAEPTRYASSEGGEDTAAALWEDAIASDGGLIGVHLKVEPPTRGVTIVAALVPEPPVEGRNRAILVQEYPPDDLAWRVTPPQGAPSRWAADEALAENVITDIRLVDEMPGGDKEGSGQLARDPRTSWPDLAPFSDISVYGPGVEEVGHYRLDKTPESDGDHMAITTEAVGWSKALEDDNAVIGPGFIDSDLTKWGGPSAQRRANLLKANLPHQSDASVTWGPSTGAALRFEVQNGWSLPTIPICEAWYDGGGVRIGQVLGDWQEGWLDANFQLFVIFSDDDVATAPEISADYYSASNGHISQSPAAARRFAYIDWLFNATPSGAEGGQYGVNLTNLKVIGDHGLPLQGTWPNVGYTASRMLGWAIPEFTSLEARPEDLEDLGFIIGQAWYSDQGPMSQVVQDLTKYELLDWFVYGGKRFQLKQPGTYGRKWQAYAGPSSLQEQGFDAARSWKEITVSYQDVDGSTRTVGPYGSGADVETASLEITDPDHPAVRAAEAYGPNFVRRDLLARQGISTPARAIEAGEIWLREAARLNRSGSASLSGYVMDDRGVMRPVSQVRAGDEVRFPDAADTSYRRIVRRSYEHNALTCTVDLDAPPEGLSALLERLQAAIFGLS